MNMGGQPSGRLLPVADRAGLGRDAYSDQDPLAFEINICDGELVGERHCDIRLVDC